MKAHKIALEICFLAIWICTIDCQTAAITSRAHFIASPDDEIVLPPGLPHHTRLDLWPGKFQARGYECPSGTKNCATIQQPDFCCSNGQTCAIVSDTGSGSVGCCPTGSVCTGQVGSCSVGWIACSNGGCCPSSLVCDGVGCVASEISTLSL